MKKFVYLLIFAASTIQSCHNSKLNEPGISHELAKERKELISNLSYELFFDLSHEENIPASAIINLDLKSAKKELLIDFKTEQQQAMNLIVNKEKIKPDFQNEHLIIPQKLLKKGKNIIYIEFIAGEMSLNKNEDFLYTLFVPDRARTCFPCFDQPDLKANFHLSIAAPNDWEVIANGKLKTKIQKEGKVFLDFQTTKPLPTYLFSFVAGKFQKISKSYKEGEINLFHRETDEKKIAQNSEEIFSQVIESLNFMEKYTQVAYPFAKYDLIAIPSFQYSGMEHTGATLYRSSKLFLSESATQNQVIDRANLIAHETAHMWFGDYVTMKWFDEVWLKEVFANFIADKITKQLFPEINNQVKFLMAHYPVSYEIDRSKGANPINQELNNLNEAGSVYGAIIYHKAPIVMQMLEAKTGEKGLQKGLQEYLKTYAYSNAGWNDLIRILDKKTEEDLMSWSKTWVFEHGMPTYSYTISDKTLTLKQSDPSMLNRTWSQNISLLCFFEDRSELVEMEPNRKSYTFNELPKAILINGKGHEYGYFEMDKTSIDFFLKELAKQKDEGLRARIAMNLWENFQNKNLEATRFLDCLIETIKTENNGLLLHLELNYIQRLFSIYLTEEEKETYRPILENVLWSQVSHVNKNLKKDFYRVFLSIAESEKSINLLTGILENQLKPEGIDLTEDDYIQMAMELAIKDPENAEKHIQGQLSRLKSKDRKAEMSFISQAASPDPAVRNAFFNSLKIQENRRPESWVLKALNYLHHPNHKETSIYYLKESLEMIEEIQQTGDIFFPKSWMDMNFKNYKSQMAFHIVYTFLKENPEFNSKLKNKLLQSTDHLYRLHATEN